MNYIPLTDCKHGFLYRLHSRNLSFGVFNKETNGFTGLRTKFNSIYLFEEEHYDVGPPYGTVKPLEELEDWTNLWSFTYSIEIGGGKDLMLALYKIERAHDRKRILNMENAILKLTGSLPDEFGNLTKEEPKNE